MAVLVYTNTSIFHGALDVSGNANTVNVTAEVDPVEATTFASSGWKEHKPGLKSFVLDYAGFGDFAGTVDSTLSTNIGAAGQIVTVAPDGATGSPAYFGQGVLDAYTPMAAKVGDMSGLSCKVTGSNTSDGLLRGKLLAAKQTIAGTTNTTGVQMFASSSVTIVRAALHVFSVSGTSTPTLTAAIQSASSQGGSYSTAATLTGATAVGATYHSETISSETDEWWRVNFTVSGSSPSFSAALALYLA